MRHPYASSYPSAIKPSFSRTTRWQYEATSGSWVTMLTVIPYFWFRHWNRVLTSSPDLLSRSVVGSSARMIAMTAIIVHSLPRTLL